MLWRDPSYDEGKTEGAYAPRSSYTPAVGAEPSNWQAICSCCARLGCLCVSGESVGAGAMWSISCVTGHMLAPSAVQQVSRSDTICLPHLVRGDASSIQEERCCYAGEQGGSDPYCIGVP